ncbi:hypothetical protein IJ103_00935 [Candidatus Saccharibacteria bacterium]|nr:hypothetical protein [Candidatus Saccharibacteria bacterium]MBQ9016797.1 hypothetical protein [Candidatus Saccharibacteria bacterium]
MKKQVNNARGPKKIICEAAHQVSNTEELRAFWEKFSSTSLLMVARASEDEALVRHLIDVIYDSLGDEKADVGAICRTFSLHWNSPQEALAQLPNFRNLVADSDTTQKLEAIRKFLGKHTCKEITPGHYSKMSAPDCYIDVHKSDIDKAIKELTRRKQPTSARMIKQFLFDSLPFVSAN